MPHWDEDDMRSVVGNLRQTDEVRAALEFMREKGIASVELSLSGENDDGHCHVEALKMEDGRSLDTWDGEGRALLDDSGKAGRSLEALSRSLLSNLENRGAEGWECGEGGAGKVHVTQFAAFAGKVSFWVGPSSGSGMGMRW